MSDEARWHVGWIVGLTAAAAGLLMLIDAVSARVLLALGAMAFPGIIGAVWRPRAEERFALPALWALGATLAVCVTGGLSGPLAVLCITPVLACLVIDGPWRAGAGFSVAAAAVCALAGVLHLPPSPPAEPGRLGLTLMALVLTVLAAGGALLTARRREEEDRDEIEAELSAFQTLMSDLPDLAVAIDAQGRTEAVFGQPLDGLDVSALHAGLAQAAAPADRSKLDAAIDEALEHGAARASFASASAPDQRITVSIQRTSIGGLVAILREAPPPARVVPATAAVATAAVSADVAQHLAAAEAGRRAAEIGRDKAEANATARARFLANMSHELRTPLNAIMGFSDMMRAKMFGELPPKYAEYAELIHESGRHLLDLINDVLDMSKIEAQRYTLSREVFDVRDALNASLRLMRLQADDAEVKLRAVLPSEPLMVDADKRAIKQIALNLISNALKFTPKDGAVILSARAVDGDLEMVVADTGMGIAADDLKRLGQPFEQAGGSEDRARGTGLGLSLVSAFAKLHGGTLTLESRLGEGTAATVRMPILVPEVQPAEVQAASPVAAVVETHPVVTEAVEPEVAAEAPAAVAHEPEPSPPRSAEPEPQPEPKPEPEPAFQAENPQPDPAPIHDALPVTTSSDTPPESAPISPPAQKPGPLDQRAEAHHGLRHLVSSIFARRPSIPAEISPPDGPPPPGPPRPDSGEVAVLG
jgi:cell cycle sensor histidine kinase DivJ